MPLVSVIMPSYNHEKFISTAIRSVLDQTFSDFELIIIDDASQDTSREIIKNFKEKDDRIHTIFHKKNRGIARTLNEGIARSKGEYVAFLASDDVWISNKLKYQLRILNSNKNKDIIIWSEGLIINEKGIPTGELFTQKYRNPKRKSGYIFEELLQGNFIFGSSFIAKKENLKNFKFNECFKYLNDWQYYVDLSKKYEYYYIPKPLAMYRIHGGNTNLDREGYARDHIMIGEYFLRKYGNEISRKVKNRIFLSMCGGYLQLGEKAQAKLCLWNAIRHDPFNRLNLVYLLNTLAGIELSQCSFLKWKRSIHKNIKNTLGDDKNV